MLNPELTYENGLNSIGKVKKTIEWTLDVNSWETIKNERLQVRDWLARTLESDDLNIEGSLHGPLEELIYNAGEHGVQFGKNGTVNVKVEIGENGTLWTIEQPTQGPNLGMILDKYESGESLRYDGVESGKERERGIGHTEAAEDKTIQIWTDSLRKDTNRIICLKLNS